MKAQGDYYEDLAANWLNEQGLVILKRNYRCKCGEIDLIARDGKHLVFIEVRARSNPRYVTAAASVDYRKQQKLLRSAQFFLQQHPGAANLPCRFDVIAIAPRQSPDEDSIQWIRSAFSQ